jgi:hypothetical protein
MATKQLNITPAASKLLTEIQKTRNVPALTALVKQCIYVRDYILGKDPEAPEFDRNLEKVKDAKSRQRVKQMLAKLDELTEKKDVSVICAAAIRQRKAVREQAAA